LVPARAQGRREEPYFLYGDDRRTEHAISAAPSSEADAATNDYEAAQRDLETGPHRAIAHEVGSVQPQSYLDETAPSGVQRAESRPPGSLSPEFAA
jgi:hypothetical protein